jgi:signal transduction histidine kinase
MSFAQRTRVGLRREVAILLPVTLLLLVLISSFTLFSYRGAIRFLQEESQQLALKTAAGLTELFAADRFPAADDLALLSPKVVRVALIDSDRRTVFEKGPQTGADLLAGFEPEQIERPTAVGPTLPEGWTTAIVPLQRDGSRHFLRVDLESGTLSRQLESIKILTWVVLSINGGLAILVLLFLRHLLRPYDRLLERARELLPEARQIEDEVSFLVSSFERAVALKNEATDSRDEITALERTLGPSLESGLLLVGTDDDVLALNPAGAEILGIEAPSEPISLNEFLVTGGEALGSVIREATESGEIIQRRETPYSRDELHLTLGLSVNPLRRDDGSIRAFLVLFADLTETRRLAEEERVASSLAQVGELAAGVAHEMRNSLATFRGYLTLVARSPEDGSIRDYLIELKRESDHMQRVLEDFLSFARPQSTRLEVIELGTIVRRAAGDPAIRDHRIEINPLAATIKGDGQLLERAFRNLLRNAVEATREVEADEPIEVSMLSKQENVEISIADRGAGVPAEIRDNVFQPFVTGKSDGVGMGLALAHRIVHLHGGRLTLDSRDGGGTVASVVLPLAREAGGGEAVKQ